MSKRITAGAMVLIAMGFIFASGVFSQEVPHLIKYQGVIPDSVKLEKLEDIKKQKADTKVYDMTFRIYSQEIRG